MTPAPGGGRPAPVSDTSKLLAGLGYILWPVALVALLIEPYKEEAFVRFHAVQALAVAVVFIVLGWIPFIGWALALVMLVFDIIAAIKAFTAEYYEIPFLYGFVRNWAES